MKVYQALSFHGSPEALEQFIREVTDRLNDGWSRKLSSEAEAPRAIGRFAFEDCLIFETYLKISEGTQRLGVGPCIFVTSNSKDFGVSPGRDNLPVEIGAVGGLYVGNLSEALGFLDGRTGMGRLAELLPWRAAM